jgi:hypothetical protein
MRQIACLAASSVLSASGLGAARAQTADQRLTEYIRLSLYTSPYAGAQIPEQWCYYTQPDVSYTWWYVTDSATGVLGALQAQNGFGIPFADADGGPNGAIIVGYVVGTGTPVAALGAVAPAARHEPACAIGARILSGGPYPIVGLAADLAHQASLDPAPEYRFWLVNGTYRRVRLIQVIPVSFQIGNAPAAGQLVLGFTGDW